MNDFSYINSGCSDKDELLELQRHPLILDFANVDPAIYDLVSATNPTLKLFFDLAKQIVSEGV